jgi:hypothetical protein
MESSCSTLVHSAEIAVSDALLTQMSRTALDGIGIPSLGRLTMPEPQPYAEPIRGFALSFHANNNSQGP